MGFINERLKIHVINVIFNKTMLLAKAFPEIYWKIHWINSELRILRIFYGQLHFEEDLIGARLSVWNNECSEPLPLLRLVANCSQAGKISHWRKKTMEIGRCSWKTFFDKKTRFDHLVSFRSLCGYCSIWYDQINCCKVMNYGHKGKV